MKPTNQVINSVKVDLNLKPEPVEIKVTKPKTKIDKHKFTSKVTLNKQDLTELRRIFMFIERARALALNVLLKKPKISLAELKREIIPALSTDELEHTLNALVSNELYYLKKKSLKELKEITAQTHSISLRENNTTNNRFSVTFRRDKILLEDFNIVFVLKDAIPEIEEPFYLNICIDEKEKFDYVYINIFHNVEKKVAN